MLEQLGIKSASLCLISVEHEALHFQSYISFYFYSLMSATRYNCTNWNSGDGLWIYRVEEEALFMVVGLLLDSVADRFLATRAGLTSSGAVKLDERDFLVIFRLVPLQSEIKIAIIFCQGLKTSKFYMTGKLKRKNVKGRKITL